MWVKSHSKEPPKWVNTPYKCIFVYLKYHKGSIIVWIVIICSEHFPSIEKLHAQSLVQMKNVFAFKPWG
jgi:hypothetical protein